MSSDVGIEIRGFKGINLREPPGMVQDDELVSCENLNIGRAGELTKRTGFSQLHNGSTFGSFNIRLLSQYQTPSHNQIIAASDDNTLWFSGNGADWTQIESSAGVFASVDAQFAIQYMNILYIVAIDGLYTWSGTYLEEVLDAPVGTFCTVYKDRLYILSTEAENNSRLYFSAIADFTNWPSTNFFDVSPGDGDFLTSCSVIQDLLIIFKTKTTWALYVQGAPENWVLRNINPEIGCISKYTPREIEGFLFFVGVRGIYKTDGNTFEDISESIEPTFRDRVVNLTTTDIDAAAWWEDRYIVLLHPDPSTYRYMVYHLRTGGWTEWVPSGGIIPAYFLEVTSAIPSKGLYAGNRAGSGRVYRHGDGAFSDAGNNYACTLQLKDFDFTLPSTMKRGKWMGIDIDAKDSVKIRHKVDEDELTTHSITGTQDRRLHKVVGPGYFRVWSMNVSNTSNANTIFYGATIYMHRKRTVIGAYT